MHMTKSFLTKIALSLSLSLKKNSALGSLQNHNVATTLYTQQKLMKRLRNPGIPPSSSSRIFQYNLTKQDNGSYTYNTIVQWTCFLLKSFNFQLMQENTHSDKVRGGGVM